MERPRLRRRRTVSQLHDVRRDRSRRHDRVFQAPGRFAIMVRSPDWIPQKGDYDVNVGASGQTRRVQVSATPHGHVIIAMHGDPAFEKSLSSAALLEVQPYDRSLRLRLPAGGAQAFARLSDCAAHEGRF
jgi:hypothetical protein